jgi:hypothetical protein
MTSNDAASDVPQALETGHCQLPALCACVVYRERRKAPPPKTHEMWGSDAEEDTEQPCRHFVHFSFRDHRRIFSHALYLCEVNQW